VRAMILAAGRGERLRPLTDSVPKSMVEVRGTKLIDRHLAMLARAGVETVVVNLDWLGEMIAGHVGSGSRYGVNVVYSPEFGNVLETGGGIRRALPVLGAESFWVVNADIYTDFEIPSEPMDPALGASLVLVPKPAHRTRGDFELEQGLVRNAAAPRYTFSGIARYRPSFFAGAPDGRYSVAPMLREAADAGTLGGQLYEGLWEDVGTPERLQLLNR
jgi:MurNAc alpha-1-phosphate uridylyltransferase